MGWTVPFITQPGKEPHRCPWQHGSAAADSFKGMNLIERMWLWDEVCGPPILRVRDAAAPLECCPRKGEPLCPGLFKKGMVGDFGRGFLSGCFTL